jgi:hypothetical protein
VYNQAKQPRISKACTEPTLRFVALTHFNCPLGALRTSLHLPTKTFVGKIFWRGDNAYFPSGFHKLPFDFLFVVYCNHSKHVRDDSSSSNSNNNSNNLDFIKGFVSGQFILCILLFFLFKLFLLKNSDETKADLARFKQRTTQQQLLHKVIVFVCF